MFNQPTHNFHHTEPAGEWSLDRRPGFRLMWLFVGIAIPIGVIAFRMGRLQVALPERFIERFERTTTTTERIAARNGRILGSDGRVLAADRRSFRLEVQYRWLEDPPDERWLRREALSRLDRRQRRDPERVGQAKADVLRRRADLWRQLATMTATSPAELAKQRQAIQTRVQRIVASVIERRKSRERSASPQKKRPADVPLVRKIWSKLRRELTTSPHRGRLDPVIVKEELDYHEFDVTVNLRAAAELESQPARFPGVRIRAISDRIYPQAALAAHVVGVRLPVREDELNRQRSISGGDVPKIEPGDLVGKSGIESTYDSLLRGSGGTRETIHSRRGEQLESKLTIPPTTGRDVVLTLNLKLQAHIEEILKRVLETNAARPSGSHDDGTRSAGAAVVVLDVRTGAVLASVSAPSFVLADAAHPTPERWQQLLNDPRRPFFNRVTQMQIPPGSVFKAVSAVAMLEHNAVNPDAEFHCQGYLSRPDQHRCYVYRHFGVGHGGIGLNDAIAKSCNVYFFRGAQRLGAEPLVDWAARFGIGRATGIDLPGERTGNLPLPPSKRQDIVLADWSPQPRKTKSPPWYPGDTLGLAIGQSWLTVTPLQIARMMAAIANGGELVTPHLVARIGPVAGAGTRQPVVNAPAPRKIGGIAPDTLARIREGLERVVNHPGGTGYKSVRHEQIRIAGKTGTAEVGGDKLDHAWFAGYAPAHQPKVAFAVVLEHGGSGGKAAGPVAKQVVSAMLKERVLHSTAQNELSVAH